MQSFISIRKYFLRVRATSSKEETRFHVDGIENIEFPSEIFSGIEHTRNVGFVQQISAEECSTLNSILTIASYSSTDFTIEIIHLSCIMPWPWL